MLIRYAIYNNAARKFFSGFLHQDGTSLKKMKAKFSDENTWLADTREDAASVIPDILRSLDLNLDNKIHGFGQQVGGNLLIVLRVEFEIND